MKCIPPSRKIKQRTMKQAAFSEKCQRYTRRKLNKLFITNDVNWVKRACHNEHIQKGAMLQEELNGLYKEFISMVINEKPNLTKQDVVDRLPPKFVKSKFGPYEYRLSLDEFKLYVKSIVSTNISEPVYKLFHAYAEKYMYYVIKEGAAIAKQNRMNRIQPKDVFKVRTSIFLPLWNRVIMEGVVTVTPGNIMAIRLGSDAKTSRQEAFDKLAQPAVDDGRVEGFDPYEHELVVPRTPFKPGTREHWPDKGLHITVAMAKRDMGGYIDTVSEEAKQLDGERVQVSFNPEAITLLEGVPANDDACGCVYYLVMEVTEETDRLMNDLRKRISLPPLDGHHRGHTTIAGIAPVDGDMEKFRREWCPPRPASGFPPPIHALKRQ